MRTALTLATVFALLVIVSPTVVTPVQGASADVYLHGSGAPANPPTLFLDSTAPTAPAAVYKDSASLAFAGGNPWKEVGTWAEQTARPAQNVTALNEAHVFVGLRNSDDQGTRFDIRVDVLKADTLIGSEMTRCVTGLTRNPSLARDVTVPIEASAPASFNGTTDKLSLQVWTRIGTNFDDTMCGGHSNATGLRLYFDATDRPSRLRVSFTLAGSGAPLALPHLMGTPGPSTPAPITPVPSGPPLDVVVMIDQSTASMTATDMVQVRNGVRSLISQLNPSPANPLTAKIAIVQFGGQECFGSLTGLLSWGVNGSGQLGNGSIPSRSVPGPFTTNPSNAVQVQAGGMHTLAYIDATSADLRTTGENGDGQLGTGSFIDANILQSPSPNTSSLQRIAAGGAHSMALYGTGVNNLRTFGDNSRGQLGTGSFITDQNTPQQPLIVGGRPVIAVAAGSNFSIAATNVAGAVNILTWGGNERGQLGRNGTADSPVPVQVPGLIGQPRGIGVAAQGAAIAAGANWGMAALSPTTVMVWGDNCWGQLGSAPDCAGVTPPTALDLSAAGASAGNGIVELAAGGRHSMARLQNGQVITWGGNTHGQLGRGNAFDLHTCGPTGSQDCDPFPRVITGFTANMISAGYLHSLALDRNVCPDTGGAPCNQVYAWGQNTNGELGIGTVGGPTNGGYSTPQVLVDVVRASWVSAGGSATAAAGMPGGHSVVAACNQPSFDAHVLTTLSADQTRLNRIVDGPGPVSACPPQATTVPGGPFIPINGAHSCPLQAVSSTGPYIVGGLRVLGLSSPQQNLFGIANGGRADARRVLIIITGGENGARHLAAQTANANAVAYADIVKRGSDGILGSPGLGGVCSATSNPPCDDVEVYTLAYVPGSLTGLEGPPALCPSLFNPGAASTAFDLMANAVSSSSPGTCSHYLPTAK